MKRKNVLAFALTIAAVLSMFVGTASAQVPEPEQDSMQIGFVTSDRTAIIKHTHGRTKLDTIFGSSGGANPVKVSHAALLSKGPDGWFLIGAKLNFKNSATNQADSAQGFFKIPPGFKFNGFGIGNHSNIQGAIMLKETDFNLNILKPLPLGTVTPNGNRWFGVWAKTGANPFTMYSGNWDGTGAVEYSIEPGNANAPFGGYHMTNICADETGMMICVVVDKLQSDGQESARLYRWRPSESLFQAVDMTGYIKPFTQNNPDFGKRMDSAFVCLLRMIPGQKKAELALAANSESNILLHEFTYEGGVPSVNVPNGRGVARSAIDDSIFFFCGWNGNVSSTADDKETTSDMRLYNNGGDMMFTDDAESVVYIVHDNIQDLGLITGPRTGIWTTHLSSGKTQLIYNDFTRFERQPIFLGYAPYEAPPPPPDTQGTVLFMPNNVMYPDSTEVGKFSSQMIKLYNPTKHHVYIRSLTIAGQNPDDFLMTNIVPNITPLPYELMGEDTITITVNFVPTAEGMRSGLLICNFATEDSLPRTAELSGLGYKEEIVGSVSDEAAAGFAVNISPNPFTSRTQVAINGKEAMSYQVSLYDLLGRRIEIPAVPQLRGTEAGFELDAASIGLTPGAYYLHITSGGASISRQIVYIR